MAEECSWIEGNEYAPECTPPTPEPTPSTTPGKPTEPPTDEPGCCTGHTPQSWTFCGQIDDKRSCDVAGQCDWLSSDPYSPECQPPTVQPTPVPTEEVGCCAGYSARTASFCDDFESAASCERAGVCSWIPTDDPDACNPPTEPPSYTEPPAPTYGGKGCCTGNSPRTWSFCGTLSDDEAMCHEAEECTWIPTEDQDSEECQPPTNEPTPLPSPLPTHDT